MICVCNWGKDMQKRKEYRNKIRSRQLIRQAFEELLKEKEYDKITATDVINRANINRSTFYAHYPDIKGIMDEITEEILETFQGALDGIEYKDGNVMADDVLDVMVKFLEEHDGLYRVLAKSDMATIYIERLKDVLIEKILDATKLHPLFHKTEGVEIRIRILFCGVTDIYRLWLIGKIDKPIDKLTEDVKKIVRDWS